MPTTVNGVGTTYFLKKDRFYMVDHCENCGNLTWLADYTTYKCICVIFIPLIPYGKARVIGYCSSCTRHRVMSFKDYTRAMTESLQQAKEAWQADPENSDAIMSLCNVMITTGHADQVDQFLEVSQASLSELQKSIVALRRLIAKQKGREALAAYEAVVAEHPGEDALAVEMLQLMALTGRKKDVGRVVTELFEANRDSVGFMSEAGDLANFAKDYDIAAKCYDRLFELRPELIAQLSSNKAVKKAYKKAGRAMPG